MYKMNFIDGHGTIDCGKLKSPTLYTAFDGQFEEAIDVALCKLMVNDTTMVSQTINVEKKDDDGHTMKNEAGEIIFETKAYEKDGVIQEYPLFSPESLTEMKKILRYIKNGKNLIRYSPRRGGMGRRYSCAEQPNPSLTGISRKVKNTLYHYMGWKDWDFVASHPSILSLLGKILRINTPFLDEWINDKDPIVKMLSDHHSVEGHPALEKDHIKTLISAALYGGGIATWGNGKWENTKLITKGVRQGRPPMEVRNVGDNLDVRQHWRQEHVWFNGLKKECKAITELLWKKNPKFIDLVCNKTLPDWGKQNQFMSYYLGVIENDCLYHTYNYFVNNNMIEVRKCALAFDGFTAYSPPSTDFDYHIPKCNDYIFKMTGFSMKLIEKPFDESTVQQHILEQRRRLPPSTVEAPIVSNPMNEDGETRRVLQQMAEQEQGDAEEVNDEEQYDQEYLVWRDNFELTHCKIINCAAFIKITYLDEAQTVFDTYVFFVEAKLKEAYNHLCYKKENDKGKVISVKYILKWLNDPNIRHYQTCNVVPPPIRCNPSTFNLWRNSPYYGKDISPSSDKWVQEAVERFIHHCDILCDNDRDASVYMLKWFAHLIQKPAEKTTHIVITGQQGTGKTILFGVLKKFIGGGVFETSTPERDVWGNFNGQLMGNLLIILSETDKRNSYGADGKIKALITDPELTINQKNKEPVVITSYHRFITLTNNPDPIKLEEGDRRNMIIRCSAEKKEDYDYFEEFAELFKNSDALLTLYSYLNNLEINDWNYRKIPKTAYHRVIMENNRDPMDAFVIWWVSRQIAYDTIITMGDDAGKVIATGSQMIMDLKAYKEQIGGGVGEHISNPAALIKKLVLGLNLPKGAIVKGTRTGKGGQKQKYDIDILKKHYKMGCLINSDGSPASAGGGEGGGADVMMMDENSQEVNTYAACDDDDISSSTEGRKYRTSSLLNMRSLTDEVDNIANEIVADTSLRERMETPPTITLTVVEPHAQVIYQKPAGVGYEDDEMIDEAIDGNIYVDLDNGMSNYKNWSSSDEEDEKEVEDEEIIPHTPLNAYDFHMENETGEKDSDYEQEEKDEEDETSRVEQNEGDGLTWTDTDGKQHPIGKREKKW